MSWDLFIQDWGDHKTLNEIPEEFQPQSIGKRSDLIEKIKSIEPTTDFSDPSWGNLENENFSIEFNMGHEEQCMGFAMHVRGKENALRCIRNLLTKLNLKATDGSGFVFLE